MGQIRAALEMACIAFRITPAPFCAIFVHIFHGEKNRLAFLLSGRSWRAGNLDTAAVAAGRMKSDNAAVTAGAKGNPYMTAVRTVGAHNITRFPVFYFRTADVAAPAFFGKIACHMFGKLDIAIVAAYRVEGVVKTPSDIAGAVQPKFGAIQCAAVAVRSVLAVKKSFPGRAHTDGAGRNMASISIRSPAAAPDIERGAERFDSILQEIL